MLIFSILLFLFKFYLLIKCDDTFKCFNELGCFNISFPFNGPFVPLPESPESINTKFKLYNKKLNNSYEVLNYKSISKNFISNKSTKFIIHGFLQNSEKKWVIKMKNELLKLEDLNVITVDWRNGSSFSYIQTIANTLIVGAEIGRLIKNIVDSLNYNKQLFHLIGHSLGAHIAGYAGEKISGLGRITGLDPAGPYFENADPLVRLDPSDALFVDVIHTDSMPVMQLGLGIYHNSGHVDFYVNGGFNQPSCPPKYGSLNIEKWSFENIRFKASCSHLTVLDYFIDSINSKCKYTAYPCSSKAEFDKGNCLTCSNKGCNRMGYWSTPNNDLGSLYLNTQSPLKTSYCKQNYLVKLVSNSKTTTNLVQARGKFTIYFDTSNEKSTVETLDDSETTFKPDSIELRLLSLNEPLFSHLQNVYVSYKKTTNFLSSWLYDNEWSFKYIEVLNGDNQVLNKFCPTAQTIQSDQTVLFRKC